MGMIEEMVDGVGPLGFFLINTLISMVPVPAAGVMCLTAGAMFGLLQGLGLYVGSATCGSALALLLGREVLTPVVVRLINWFYGGKEGEEKLAAISKAVAKDGFKVVTLMRLSPAFPFAIVTLLLSLTKVKHFTHFKATALGLIPSSFVYIYAGAVGADATEGAMGPSDWAITICGGIATVWATVKVVAIANEALKGATGDDDEK
eukprot:gene18345-17294_t